jgi:hypothetical protein
MAEANVVTEKPSSAVRAGAAVKEGWDKPWIGEGHFEAWIRQGFKELTHMLLPAFPAGQHIVEEQGLFGNPTPGEVQKGREGQSAARPPGAMLKEEPVQRETAARSTDDIADAKAAGTINVEQKQSLQSPSEIADGEDRQHGQQQSEQRSQSHTENRGHRM